MLAKAHAKINWDLRILGRRADHFHELDSVFVTLSLSDELSFESAEGLGLTCSDAALPVDGSNLVVKAATLLALEAGREFPERKFGAKMHLVKHIPMGGGMGGGSSDAACALAGLNRLWQLNWELPKLAGLAGRVGSDVAYFLYGGWCLCRGRGEIVEPLPGAEQWPALQIWMLLPPLHVATPAVYKALRCAPWDGGVGRGARETADGIAAALAANAPLNLRNDLAAAALQVEPRLAGIQTVLEQFFPGRWLMSGSGASHFALSSQHEPFMRRAEFEKALQAAVPGTRIVEAHTVSARQRL